MKIEDKDEQLRGHYLPENFAESGRSFNGMFKTKNLVEAIIVSIPLAIISWFLFAIFPLNWRIVLTVMFAGLGFCAGIYGWQGDSLFEFIHHVYVFNQRKRYAKYNERVKTEIKPNYLFKDRPQNSMDEILEKIRAIIDGTSDEKYDSSEIKDTKIHYVFEEDLAVTETPDNLKTRRELKREEKERQKRLKEAQKIRRQEEKRKILIEQASRDRLRQIEKEERKKVKLENRMKRRKKK